MIHPAPEERFRDAWEVWDETKRILAQVAPLAAPVPERIQAFLMREVEDRQLPWAHQAALADYLAHLREQQLPQSPLPLIRAHTQTAVRIKDVFVEIAIRLKKDPEAGKTEGPQPNQEGGVVSTANGTKEISARLRQRKRAPQVQGSGEAVPGLSEAARPSPRPRGRDTVDTPAEGSELGRLLLEMRKVVFLGPPGGGKSTLLKRAALAFAEARGEDLPGWPRQFVRRPERDGRGDEAEAQTAPGMIPVFMRLRSFAAYLAATGPGNVDASPPRIVDYLGHYYRNEQKLSLPPDFFDRLLQGEGCAVFMDGLDEVAEALRTEVARHVDAFVRCYEQARMRQIGPAGEADRDGQRANIFVLASRPKGYEAVREHLPLNRYAVCEVKSLDLTSIRQLLANVLRVIEPNAERRDQDFVGLSKAILNSRELTVLAGTPLFCTSLVLVYKYRGAELPRRRVDVFDDIVSLLLGFWKAEDRKPIPGTPPEDDEGIGSDADLGAAVTIRKKRLSHIALQMQLGEKRTEIDLASLAMILRKYLVKEEHTSPGQAKNTARHCLKVFHARSGLLVEMEPRIYAFTHEGFREYLVAHALINFRETQFVNTVLKHIDDPIWDEVLLLAAAHPGLSDGLRVHLLKTCLKDARERKGAGDPAGWARRMIMAGRMAFDMGEYLSPKYRARLRDELAAAAADTSIRLEHRIALALVLDGLGWLSDTPFTCVPIPDERGGRFYLGKNLVANQQYERFLNAADFEDLELWTNTYCVDCNGEPYPLADESAAWHRSNPGDKRLPKSWNDSKFGTAHRGLPVVGVSWFEANAYCRWLTRHWDGLAEADANPGIRPKDIRLPTEREWRRAVLGDEPGRRFPWERSPRPAAEDPVPEDSDGVREHR